MTAPAAERTFFGHPRALATLFLTEMWERFSYYGMRALLIFYLTQHFLFSKDEAYLIYGAYTALVYLAPVIGGFAADRWLGARRAVIFGGVLLVCGHLGMVVESGPAQVGEAGEVVRDARYVDFFYLSLAFIVIGVGFLKANVSTLVGALYERNDIRRDPAFTIFYMGINVGGALGGIVAGALGQTFGWRYGFGAAGLGMVLGLIQFVLGAPLLEGRGDPPDQARLSKRLGGLRYEVWVYAAALACVVATWLLLKHERSIGWLLGLGGIFVVGYIVLTSVRQLDRIERERIFAALCMMALSVLFWALFEQAGSSLNVFADERIERTLFGIQVPASVFQSLGGVYIVLLAPLFAMLWSALGRRGRDPSAPAKFGLALIQLGLGFLVLVLGVSLHPETRTPLHFLFLLYLLHTTGELCLSPVGLSSMTRLAAPHMVGLIMGTWFFAQAAGNFLSGLIAQATHRTTDVATDQAIEVYGEVGLFAVAVGLAVLVLSPSIRRMMHLDS